MYGSTPEIAHERIDGCVGAVCPVGLEIQESMQACQQFPESVWIELAYRCAAVDGYKTTIVFSTFAVCSKIQYALDSEKLIGIKNLIGVRQIYKKCNG